jgi:hypothetical protein
VASSDVVAVFGGQAVCRAGTRERLLEGQLDRRPERLTHRRLQSVDHRTGGHPPFVAETYVAHLLLFPLHRRDCLLLFPVHVQYYLLLFPCRHAAAVRQYSLAWGNSQSHSIPAQTLRGPAVQSIERPRPRVLGDFHALSHLARLLLMAAQARPVMLAEKFLLPLLCSCSLVAVASVRPGQWVLQYRGPWLRWPCLQRVS